MRTAVIVASAVLLVACGSTDAGDAAGEQGNGQPPMYGAACPDATVAEGFDLGLDEPRLPRLGDKVSPTGVLRCTLELRDIDGEGRWSVVVGSWADSDLDAFLAALRKPDEHTTEVACPAIGIVTPWFELVTADGRLVRVHIPRDVCGQPQEAVLVALSALRFTTVSETRVRQLETAEAQAAGCEQEWKDMVAIVAAEGDSARKAERPVLPGPTPSKVRVCVYRSDGTPPEQTPGGNFVSGPTLEGSVLDAAFAGLESAPPAGECTRRATTYAVLMDSEGGEPLTVEIDGCHRMLTAADELRAAPEGLIAALR